MSADEPARGDVFWVDFDPARGSEQSGRRPGVVISSDGANRALPVVTIAAITTKKRASSPLQLVLPRGRPCAQESAVLGFHVVSIDKGRLDGFVGSLDAEQMESLRRLLRNVWAL